MLRPVHHRNAGRISGSACRRHNTRRLNLECVRLLFVEQDAQRPNLLLYGGERRDERRQRHLVLGHESPDVIDVLFLLVVILDVLLNVLESAIEYSQRPLDGIELRQ